MRMFAQDQAFYRGIRVDGTEHPEALGRLRLLEQVAPARRKGLGVADALELAELPRSTYYDWCRRHRQDGLEGLGSAKQPPADASWEELDARGRAAGVRHSRGDALVRQGASAFGAQPPAFRFPHSCADSVPRLRRPHSRRCFTMRCRVAVRLGQSL